MIRRRAKVIPNWKVTIKTLTDKQYDKQHGKDSWACWDSLTRTVYLRSSRPIDDVAADFEHELEHVVVDYKLWFKQHQTPSP